MKNLIFAMMLISGCVQAGPGYIVFGDSQAIMTIGEDTNATDVWPYIVQGATGIHMLNISRGGRQAAWDDLTAYLVNSDIIPNQELKGVILALGTNDRWWGIDTSLVEQAVLNSLNETSARGLQLICILPPDNLYKMKGVMSLQPQRDAISRHCPVTISLDIDPWTLPDGVHFDRKTHRHVATRVISALDQMGELQ